MLKKIVTSLFMLVIFLFLLVAGYIYIMQNMNMMYNQAVGDIVNVIGGVM